MVPGPAAVTFCVLVREDRFGLRPDAPVSAGLGLAFALLIGVAGPLVSVAALVAAILMGRHWREALPLWFLAAGSWHTPGRPLHFKHQMARQGVMGVNTVNSGTQATQVLRIAEEHGLVRSSDLTRQKIPRATLMRLVRAGRLKQIARGVYALPDQPLSAQHSLAEIAARSSHGVLCLLTALHFHKITRRPSNAIWLAIPNKARAPKDDHPPLCVVRFSGASLTEGVESYVIDGVTTRVYSVAKTVADCFKFRHKVGLDVAVGALRKCLRNGRASREELWHYAQVCRVTEVMLPYLEHAAMRPPGRE